MTAAATALEPRPGVRGATMITRSGIYFDFLAPDPATITPEDIAWGLSNACRFNGQCTSFYSVAQHCVLASHIVPASFAFAALLHDASEAYTGDMISPLKQLLPEFKAIEKRIEAAVAVRFGIPPEMPPEIKHADLRMLHTEKRDLTAGAAHDWNGLEAYPPLLEPIQPWEPVEAYTEWMRRFEELYELRVGCDLCGGSGSLYVPATLTGRNVHNAAFASCVGCDGAGIIQVTP